MIARAAGLLLLAALVTPAAARVTPGAPAPALAAPLASGELLKLDALRGRVVYLDFWASWCPPCRAAMPEYEKLWRELAPQGFSVIGVNLDTERAAALRALHRSAVSFPVVFDPEGRWPATFDLPAMPSAYLIDRAGVVRHVQEGFRRDELPALRERILELLQEQP